ncbi:MAG: type II toxin-antitoxin system mRNA interferase toxin, RelE/StbE family [Thiomonas sp.]
MAAITAFIAERNEPAANPYLYRAGRIPGTCELVAHPNDIVVYQVTERLEVLNVLHARQNYPR